jgi:ABC-type proline/glycine betaine transport system permease subunit
MVYTKENFCPACLAAPLAFTGLGATSIGATEEEKDNHKKLLLWGGIIITIISILAYIYYKRTCKECK